jgi:hypothetical protein
MRKLIPVILLGLSLGGCAFLQNIQAAVGVAVGLSVTPNQAFIAANAYDITAKTAAVYLQLPLCSATQSKLCRTQANSVTLYKQMLVGRTARNNLLAAINTANGPVSASLYTVLSGQTSTLQQLLVSLNAGS